MFRIIGKIIEKQLKREICRVCPILVCSVDCSCDYSAGFNLLKLSLGLYLTDLTFIEEGHLDYVESDPPGNKWINFIKCRQFSQVIEDIRKHQRVSYSFEPVGHLQYTLKSLEPMSSDDLYKLSHELEPSATS